VKIEPAATGQGTGRPRRADAARNIAAILAAAAECLRAVDLMHLAATETAAGRVSSEEVPGLLSATLLPALSPQQSGAVPAADRRPATG